MLRQFQRRAHHYITDPPSPEHKLEWLALIQHHGGPTRLLDFTHSFYVAAFFALERATQDAAIWAVNLDALEQSIRDKKKLGPRGDDNVDRTNAKLIDLTEANLRGEVMDKLVIHVEPDRMNERISIQQGLFLFPCDISCSFEDNLAATFDLPLDIFQRQVATPFSMTDLSTFSPYQEKIIKIVVPRKSVRVALIDLQAMNVTSATLFPGLDGFARSLYYHLRMIPFKGGDDMLGALT